MFNINHLFADLKSLEYTLEHGMIEDDIVRMGAGQEFCLVNEYWRPASNAMEILEQINDDHFTTELAKYNLEINLDPLEIKTDAFQHVKTQLTHLLNKAREAAVQKGDQVLLSGILPTISKDELGIEYMTPISRHHALKQMLMKQRDSDFSVQFIGVDEIAIKHNSMMF